MSITHLRKLARLSLREWADLLEAQLALFAAQLRVWTRPTGHLVSHSSPSGSGGRAVSVDAANDPRAPALALALGRAAEFGLFRPLCLVRAVALNRMLERHGIAGSRVRIGVRMRNGRFAAHAWVEYGDRVLGDVAEHVDSFAELSEVHLIDAP